MYVHVSVHLYTCILYVVYAYGLWVCFMCVTGAAVGLLKDTESLDSTLEYLGLKHQGFSITKV